MNRFESSYRPSYWLFLWCEGTAVRRYLFSRDRREEYDDAELGSVLRCVFGSVFQARIAVGACGEFRQGIAPMGNLVEAEKAQAEVGRSECGVDRGLFEKPRKVQGQVDHECAEGHGGVDGAAGMLVE